MSDLEDVVLNVKTYDSDLYRRAEAELAALRAEAELHRVAHRETLEALEAAREALKNIDGWDTWAKSGGGYREAFHGLLESGREALAALSSVRTEAKK